MQKLIRSTVLVILLAAIITGQASAQTPTPTPEEIIDTLYWIQAPGYGAPTVSEDGRTATYTATGNGHDHTWALRITPNDPYVEFPVYYRVTVDLDWRCDDPGGWAAPNPGYSFGIQNMTEDVTYRPHDQCQGGAYYVFMGDSVFNTTPYNNWTINAGYGPTDIYAFNDPGYLNYTVTYEVSLDPFQDCSAWVPFYGDDTEHTVAATSEAGNTHTVQAGQGAWFEYRSGTWSHDGVATRTDLAVSLDDGASWSAWGGQAVLDDAAICLDAANARIYVEAGEDDIRIRVNDYATWGANTGSVTYATGGATWYGTGGYDPVVIQDGQMELKHPDYFWYWHSTIEDTQAKFGRKFDTDGVTSLLHGQAFCGDGYQRVGTSWGQNGEDTTLYQSFDWAGGDLYWRYAVRALGGLLPFGDPQYLVLVQDILTGDNYYIADNLVVPGSAESFDTWANISGSISDLPPGTYRLYLARSGGSYDWWGIYYDNVVLSYIPTPELPDGCVDQTPTETQTPTPTANAADNLIRNCGFSQGDLNWNMVDAEIRYDDPVLWDPNIAVIQRIEQTFNWTSDGYIFYRASHMGYARAEIVAPFGSTYELLDQSNSIMDWSILNASIYLPAGSYTLRITSGPNPGYVFLDKVALSRYGPVDCVEGSTFTPTPAQSPTPMTGTPPVPSRTPSPTPYWNCLDYPEWCVTPGAGTPTRTPVPGSGGGEIPPQPPAACEATCVEPYGFDVPAWLTYQTCRAQQYVVWCPRHTEKLQSIATPYMAIEPFYTVNMIVDAQPTIEFVYSQYEWANTPAPTPTLRPWTPAVTPVLDERGTPVADVQAVDAVTAGQSMPEPGRDWGWLGENSPYNGGDIDLMPATGTIQPRECSKIMGDVAGGMAVYMCWFFDILAQHGLLPWFQALVNIPSIFALVLYLRKSIKELGKI